MLELKAAPSQNPVLPAANAASNAPGNAAATAGEGADGNSLPQQGMSFAALLKQHVSQGHGHGHGRHGLDKKTAASAVDALLEPQTDAATAAGAGTEAAADPIALLAPMLAGIAVPQAGEAEDVDVAPVATAAEVAETPGVIIAAPVATTVPTPATDTADPAATEAPLQTTVDNLPREGEKPLPSMANIAAQSAASAEEGAAEAGVAADTQNFEAALKDAQLLVNPHAPVRSPQSATPAPASTPVATPVGAPGWGNEIGDKVVWMVGRQETRAELVLNPPNLGRVEVSLTMNGDQATATFTSANATVREALENAMPRLREVLQGAGISLGQTQVGAESFQQAAQQQQTGDNSNRGNGRGNAEDAPQGLALGHEHAPGQIKRGIGLVDTFA